MRQLLPDLHSTNHQFWTVTVLAQKAVCAKVVQRVTVHERQYSVSYPRGYSMVTSPNLLYPIKYYFLDVIVLTMSRVAIKARYLEINIFLCVFNLCDMLASRFSSSNKLDNES